MKLRFASTQRRGLALAAQPLGKPALVEAQPKRLVVRRNLLTWPLYQTVRIAHISDIHAGMATPLATMRQAVFAARRAMPDMVVLTGDYLNRSLRYVERLRRFVAALPKPRVAVLGNHDYWSCAHGVVKALESEDVIVLRNESRRIRLPGGDITVVGVDDGATKHDDAERAFFGAEDAKNALVLTHHPKTADDVAPHGGRLVLAGHTHGGQIVVPLLTDAICKLHGHEYLGGWYDVSDDTRLYVNAGIGSGAVGIRVGNRACPEVAIFDLIPKSL
jgi:predicted MPP superfamily phosphohydrolase